MKSIALKGDPRTDLGKSATKALRKQGMVPCVLYGGDDVTHFSAYEADFKNLVYTPNSYLVRLEVDGKMCVAKLQDIQYHPVSEQILHADFYEVKKDQPISIKVPIRVTGNSPGVREGGKLQVKIRKLLVKGLVDTLPDEIIVNVDTLKLGKSIRVREVNAGGVELLDFPENSVISCNITRASRSAAAGGEEEAEAEGGEGAEETAAAEE